MLIITVQMITTENTELRQKPKAIPLRSLW